MTSLISADNRRLADAKRAKQFGAYYTDRAVADFLVDWVLASSSKTLLDPSFGSGVFLRAGAQKFKALGVKPVQCLYGVEIDKRIHRETAQELANEMLVDSSKLFRADFFDIEPGQDLPYVDAIVGNPPFVRHQRLSTSKHTKGLKKAVESAVALNELSSYWAPFLVHSISFLKKGGRLGMVLPIELIFASYARPILSHLENVFGKVRMVLFKKRLFPHLNQDVILLLAEDFGGSCKQFLITDLDDLSHLEQAGADNDSGNSSSEKSFAKSIQTKTERIQEHYISASARSLYRELKQNNRVSRFGDLMDVRIGYVTGANDFFHLSEEDIDRWDIPDDVLKRSVRRGRSLNGLLYTNKDWKTGLQSGESGYLLHIENEDQVTRSLRKYLNHGKKLGVTETYKCMNRALWYGVPSVCIPDGFFAYMSGRAPHIVANKAKVVAPNSLYILHVLPQAGSNVKHVGALWQTSLSVLSAELEGRPMGGGMLKLEPSEVRRSVIALPAIGADKLDELASEMDLLLRQKKFAEARSLADKRVLADGLGLSKREISTLTRAAQELCLRRTSK